MPIQLCSPLLIAKGGHRACYHHPKDNKLCIKVHHNVSQSGRVETERELRYYRFISHKKISCPIIPHYYGIVNTNLGSGYVYERISDIDNSTSKTLDVYLLNGLQRDENIDWLKIAWQHFKQEALSDWLVTKKLHPYNLLVRNGAFGDKRIIVVDNLGSSAWVALPYYSKWLAQLELHKRFAAFEQLVYRQYHFSL